MTDVKPITDEGRAFLTPREQSAGSAEFNAQYLADFATANSLLKTATIRTFGDDSTANARVVLGGDPNFVGILMPIRETIAMNSFDAKQWVQERMPVEKKRKATRPPKKKTAKTKKAA